MNNELLKIMKQYNKAIDSWNRAEEYFNSDIPLEEKQSRELDCKILVNHINGLIQKIKDMDYPIDDYEILNGFKQIKYLYKEKPPCT